MELVHSRLAHLPDPPCVVIPDVVVQHGLQDELYELMISSLGDHVDHLGVQVLHVLREVVCANYAAVHGFHHVAP